MEGQSKVITIVCTGNVCRSPMAERLLKHALDAEKPPLDQIQVYSAGVSAFPGDPASSNAITALAKVNLDLRDHRSRPLSSQLVEISDLILTMTSSHLEMIQMQYPEAGVETYRFREWVSEGTKEVSDPFGGPLSVYLETLDSIAEAIPSILKFLRTRYTQ